MTELKSKEAFMEIKQNVSQYFIQLLKSTIQNQIPAEKPDDVERRDVLNLAAYHKVDEMAFCAVEKLKKSRIKRYWTRCIICMRKISS